MKGIISLVSLLLCTYCFGQTKVDLLKLVERYGTTYYMDSKTPFSGVAEEINEDHTFVDIYKEGKLDGKSIVYNKDGSLFKLTTYVNGLKEGGAIVNYLGGGVYNCYYKNDVLEGLVR